MDDGVKGEGSLLLTYCGSCASFLIRSQNVEKSHDVPAFTSQCSWLIVCWSGSRATTLIDCTVCQTEYIKRTRRQLLCHSPVADDVTSTITSFFWLQMKARIDSARAGKEGAHIYKPAGPIEAYHHLSRSLTRYECPLPHLPESPPNSLSARSLCVRPVLIFLSM